tara:strand:- start:866 stop:1126 length:261 start_codon:yes stop_codon:yes gene_type:complete
MNKILLMMIVFFSSSTFVHSDEKILKITCNGFLGDCASIPSNMCGNKGYTMVNYNIAEYIISDKTSISEKKPTNKIVYDIFFKCNK